MLDYFEFVLNCLGFVSSSHNFLYHGYSIFFVDFFDYGIIFILATGGNIANLKALFSFVKV